MYSNNRLVILDADGTTVDAFDAIQKAFTAEGMDLGDLSRFQKRRNIFKYIGGLKEFPTNLKQQIGKKKRLQLIETLTDVYRNQAKMFDGIPDLINRMIGQPNLKVGIVTRNITMEPHETLTQLLARHGVDTAALDFFVHIPLSEEKTHHFRKLRENFNANPALSYACGDEKKDYVAALGSGLFPFIVSYGFESTRRLMEKALVPEELISHTPNELIKRVSHTLQIESEAGHTLPLTQQRVQNLGQESRNTGQPASESL